MYSAFIWFKKKKHISGEITYFYKITLYIHGKHMYVVCAYARFCKLFREYKQRNDCRLYVRRDMRCRGVAQENI